MENKCEGCPIVCERALPYSERSPLFSRLRLAKEQLALASQIVWPVEATPAYLAVLNTRLRLPPKVLSGMLSLMKREALIAPSGIPQAITQPDVFSALAMIEVLNTTKGRMVRSVQLNSGQASELAEIAKKELGSSCLASRIVIQTEVLF